jgi:penicillin-binding protein 1A
VSAIYLGYDQPRSLGGYAQGGRIAAPIFKDFVLQTRKRWSDTPFTAPEGIRMVKIDRVSGRQVFGGIPQDDQRKASVIWEAFKPNSEPTRTFRPEDQTLKDAVLEAIRKARAAKGEAPGEDVPVEEGDFVEDKGGIY